MDMFALLGVEDLCWEFDSCHSLSYAYTINKESESVWLTILQFFSVA